MEIEKPVLTADKIAEALGDMYGGYAEALAAVEKEPRILIEEIKAAGCTQANKVPAMKAQVLDVLRRRP